MRHIDSIIIVHFYPSLLITNPDIILPNEKTIAEYTGSKHAIATVNGTAALHISLLLAGVKPSNEVIVPTITFIAPVNAIKYCNAEPVFMDCDDQFNLDINKTIEFISNNTFQKRGKCINKNTKNQDRNPIVNPVRKKILAIDDLLIPIVLRIAISFVLFFTKMVSPEIILKAATIIIKVKIMNITFLSTFKAPKKDLFRSAHE